MNRTLRIKYWVNYPKVHPCADLHVRLRPSKSCLMPGIFVEFLNIIVRKLNLTIIEVKRINEDEFINDPPLMEHELDKYDLVSDFYGKSDVTNKFDLSDIVYWSDTRLITRQVDQSMNDLLQFISIYDCSTWFSIGLILLCLILFGILIHLIELKLKLIQKREYRNTIWKFVRLNMLNYESFEFKLMSGNLGTFIFALLQCAIMIGMYNNVIRTKAIRTDESLPFKPNDLVNVLDKKRFTLIFKSELKWYYRDILNFIISPYYEIRQTFKENPPLFMSKDRALFGKEFLDKIDKDPTLIGVLERDQNSAVLSTKYCNLIYMESPFRRRPKHFMMRKGHPLLNEINQVIKEETVSFIKIYNKYKFYKFMNYCESDNMPKALSLTPYYIIIQIFVAGTLLGSIIFLIEFLIGSRRRRKKNVIVLKCNIE